MKDQNKSEFLSAIELCLSSYINRVSEREFVVVITSCFSKIEDLGNMVSQKIIDHDQHLSTSVFEITTDSVELGLHFNMRNGLVDGVILVFIHNINNPTTSAFVYDDLKRIFSENPVRSDLKRRIDIAQQIIKELRDKWV